MDCFALHELISTVENNVKEYNLPAALKPVLPFIDDASNWYVRRSRRRFWKSGSDQDKNAAYTTLHYVLTTLSKVLAPFTPFLAEELFQKLTGGESVHLCDWPKAGHVNEMVTREMGMLRDAINKGLAERAKAGVKVRQPLASATLVNVINANLPKELNDELVEIAKEELNVKEVKLRGLQN